MKKRVVLLCALAFFSGNLYFASPVFADSSADIAQRLDALEQEIKVLRRQLEVKKEEEDKK
jgi:hypothetical protein